MSAFVPTFRRQIPRIPSKLVLALLVLTCFYTLRSTWSRIEYENAARLMLERVRNSTDTALIGSISPHFFEGAKGQASENAKSPQSKPSGSETTKDSAIPGKVAPVDSTISPHSNDDSNRPEKEDTLGSAQEKGEEAAASSHARPALEHPVKSHASDEAENTGDKSNQHGKPQETLQTVDGSQKPFSSSVPCANLPGAEDVLMIVKFGVTEIYEKLPHHFLTTFLCAPQIILWSDFEQKIGPHQVHDAIASPYGPREELISSHDDFADYRRYPTYFNKTQDLGTLKGERGWNLDKWKFMPMMLDSYKRYPDKKWYIVVETDTYLSWSNLLIWTSRLDPTMPIYAGCVVLIGNFPFLHGGSSFLMSNPSLQKLAEIAPSMKETWENRTLDECCGDQVLGEALDDVGIRPMDVFPTIQGKTPTTLDWSELKWCAPVISWHHLSSAEVDALWRFEQEHILKHGPNTPILFADHFEHFVEPHLTERREDWDNFSEEVSLDKDKIEYEVKKERFSAKQRIAPNSWEECRDACEEMLDCKQYVWEPELCRLSPSIRLGKFRRKVEIRDDNDDIIEVSVVSGWMLDRIQKFKEEHSPCDRSNGWVTHAPPLKTEVQEDGS